jgi:hypothetical protein
MELAVLIVVLIVAGAMFQVIRTSFSSARGSARSVERLPAAALYPEAYKEGGDHSLPF